MKKLFSVLIFSLFVLKSFAGWEMMFCESVDASNNCTGKSSTFNLAGTEVKFVVLLQNSDGIRTDKIYIEIYKVDPATFAEDLVSTEETKVQPADKIMYHMLSISKKGNYLIKVRDAFKDYITSREVEIK